MYSKKSITTEISSRVRRCRLIPLTEPYVRASYTAPAYLYSYVNTFPILTVSRLNSPNSVNH
ncbi:hypothetical protein ERW57_12760 [Aliivibrio finisterrensis]|uniref:Uncharacterized protein n=1 Tax=Aliivibrio finisterrensis TaxID=511998 RepID=A0A4Q5KW82_9GAMM|nr:hypothetical protein ERW57_12760 [Aliivibrio finisterrensis]RYU82040.1 hypothetical protein ERW55_13605 [Aliivibrio finisterrensis]